MVVESAVILRNPAWADVPHRWLLAAMVNVGALFVARSSVLAWRGRVSAAWWIVFGYALSGIALYALASYELGLNALLVVSLLALIIASRYPEQTTLQREAESVVSTD